MEREAIDFKAIAAKWQKRWDEKKVFKAAEGSKKKKYYVLEMYPYPSASYLHMGHVRNYTIGDVYARFKRMQGFNVLYPMGYDSFGLPAETAAKKEGIHPKLYTENAIKKISAYFKQMGNSYDWDKTLSSHDPDFFKWNQYFFIKLYEKGLAYVKNAPVNWCENCQSVLANEEAEGGVCWRCEKEVGKKELKQWFYKITSYADKLLEDLKKIDWPEKIKVMQENWIGKSHGTEITFMLDNQPWNIFTTRPDTIFGVTFMVISAMHQRLLEITESKYKKEVEAFVKKCEKVRTPEETEALEKEGVFIGKFAINPINNEKVPVYAGNFVVADYGCGMVMAVPAHDQRDFEFAKKYNIPIKVVINPPMYDLNADRMSRAYTAEGRLINSGEFTGSENKDAIEEITSYLEKIGKGKKTVQYKIRDWLISRQRYWGTPIPIIYCNNCAKGDVLVLHGWEDSSKSGSIPELVKDLKSKGYKPHAFDQPGTKAPNFEEWFSFAEEKIKEIGKDNLSIVGHSMGGLLALKLAEKYKVKKLVLLAPVGARPSEKYYNSFSKKELPEEELAVFKKYMDRELDIKKIKKNAEKIVFIFGKKDPWIKEEIRNYYTSNFCDVASIHLLDYGHMGENEGVKKLPLLEDQFPQEAVSIIPVPIKDLPVLLPEKVDFNAAENPLLSSKEFFETKCPKCGGHAHRETDTMGGFVDSSWYFLRYCDNKNKTKPFDAKKVNYWMPVDQYVGGAEHAVMHLIYARFFVKALKDLGFVDFDEPFAKLFNQGILYKDGAKMSKSKGNIVTQDQIENSYGIDTARFFLMFLAAPDKTMEWDDKTVEGTYRFLVKVYRMLSEKKIVDTKIKNQESRAHKTILEVTEYINDFKYNLALISIMKFGNYLHLKDEINKKAAETLLLLLAPFTPHLAEELWEKLGNKEFISLEKWPAADKKKIDEKLEAADELYEKVRNDILTLQELTGLTRPNKVKLILPEKWKYDAVFTVKNKIGETRDIGKLIQYVIEVKTVREDGKIEQLKDYAKEISQIVPKLVKNPMLIPVIIVTYSDEEKALTSFAKELEKEFGSKFEITIEKQVKHEKAKNAMPGKPAIVFE